MDEKRLDNLASEFKTALDAQLSGDDRCEFRFPSREAVAQVCRHYLGLLFPVFYRGQRPGRDFTANGTRHYLAEVETLLREQLCSAMRFDTRSRGSSLPLTLRIVPRIGSKICFASYRNWPACWPRISRRLFVTIPQPRAMRPFCSATLAWRQLPCNAWHIDST